ncbi:hypothetical protein [Brachyspira pilosicoli]|uniref:Lipoprotein n=1 Tax=Brachyspira pilosicoli TaxID=52584 RepID=A0A5C8EXT7_BRAPL|nr:hypothetical protein [Brachyspira pilosicoli]TXJ41894.1 hypothetical protein EPJ72_06120 [Brachyspira pilosicoli]
MKILFLVLFFLFTSLSCKQNPRSVLSSPPKIEEGITNNNTGSSNTNSGGNNDLNSGYGYYDVLILGDNGTIITNQYKISDTDKLLEAYSNMIIDSQSGKARFELSKNDNKETYTFDKDLNLIKKEANKNAGTTTARNKQFRGVCLVIIYPDATDAAPAIKTANSSLLGNYTIAGIYREEENSTAGGAVTRAMTKSENFQNAGFDELIILRPDELTTDASTKNTNYRADILFNDAQWISFYNYDPDRTFEKQNTNYNFVKATP